MKVEDYIQWVKENDILIKSQEIGDFVYSVRYLPVDFQIANELQAGNHNAFQLDTLRISLSEQISFIFKISSIDGESTPLRYNVTTNEEYSYNLQYCSFNIADDFFLINKDDTLKCVSALLIREYAVKSDNTIILTFESGQSNDIDLTSDLKVVYEDRMWGNGIIKFTISEENLKRIPILKY
ncbi:MAG: hypothetical protein JXR48_01960 [Candidatus Delongbacteria bacterium]|nr:hypothetical protein [Candidatus Delongbacteria bacterium]